jgi:hypothetical protein
MKKFKIGFSTPKKQTIFSSLIKLFLRTKYSHIYLERTSEFLDVTYIYQASGLSVNFENAEYFKQKNHVVSEFEFEVPAEVYNKIISAAMKKAGRPYGIKQVFGIAWTFICPGKVKNPFADGSYSYICSELIAELLDIAGIVNKNSWSKSMDSITPKDVFEKLEELNDGNS